MPQILGPTDDLLGYWPLDSIDDGTVEDIVGNNDGTTKGDVLDRPGQVNRAAEFDGDDDYVNVPDDSVFDLNAFTISL